MFESVLIANIVFIIFGVLLLYSLIINFSIEQITLTVAFVFLLKLHVNQELNLLIHPRYFWLVYSALVVIYILIVLNKTKRKFPSKNKILLSLLNLIFIVGILADFQPLSSAARQSNFDTNNITQLSRDLRFTNFTQNTDDFQLEDWLTLFSLDPEPAKYESKEIKVEGFYFIDQSGEPMIAKYILSCCAADARIMGIWLADRLPYQSDQWVELSGTLTEIEMEGVRTIAIKVNEHKKIPTPDIPYVTN